MYALEDGLDEYEEHQSVDTGLECDGLVGNLADDVSLDSVLSSMSREELESLVLELASRNSDIRGLVWERYADRLSSSFILEIRNHIDATIDSIRRTGADEWYDEEYYYSIQSCFVKGIHYRPSDSVFISSLVCRSPGILNMVAMNSRKSSGLHVPS